MVIINSNLKIIGVITMEKQERLGNAYGEIAEPDCFNAALCGANACMVNAGACKKNGCAVNATICGAKACIVNGGTCGADACGVNWGKCGANACTSKH